MGLTSGASSASASCPRSPSHGRKCQLMQRTALRHEDVVDLDVHRNNVGVDPIALD